MQKLKTNTKGIVSILRASSDMRLYLGLTRVPVHSTIVRFVNKIRKQINKLLGIRQAVTVAVDATGFELENKSYYYRTVWNRRRKTKRFMKLSIAVDTDKELYRRRPTVENIIFCIKRKYGSVLRNRTYATQKVELISKLIAHNVDMMQHYLLLILRVAPALILERFKKGFYRRKFNFVYAESNTLGSFWKD